MHAVGACFDLTLCAPGCVPVSPPPRRYTCHGTAPCGVLVDVCHDIKENFGHACKNASVTVAVSQQEPAGSVVITGWVLFASGLSGALECMWMCA